MIPKKAGILIPVCEWRGRDDGTAVAFQELSQEAQYIAWTRSASPLQESLDGSFSVKILLASYEKSALHSIRKTLLYLSAWQWPWNVAANQ